MISKTYCPLPFNHLYITPSNTASVCCAFRRDEEIKANMSDIKEYKNLSDHFRHPFIKDIQQKMLSGEKVAGCERCYYFEEHSTGESMRQGFIDTWHNKDWRNLTPPDVDNPKLEFLEMSFGNYCNLACRSCGSNLSHSWIEDEKELSRLDILPESIGNMKRVNVEREWQDDDLKDLRHLKITGGEPMLHPDFPKFLEKLNLSEIFLEIYTNASWIPKKKLLDMLSKFKFCAIYLSVDGTGTVQEYMRHNAKWNITEDSTRKWLEMMKVNHNNIQIVWTPTWSLMNGNYYIETCNWWLETINKILDDLAEKCRVTHGAFLLFPAYYKMNLLPNQSELKQNAKKYINELRNSTLHGTEDVIKMTESYIEFFKTPPKNEVVLKNTYFKLTNALDKIRNQSLKEMMPLTYDAMYNQKEVLK